MLQNSFPLFLAYCTYLPTQSTNIKVQIYKAFTLYNTSVMFLLGILSEMKCADSETSKIIVSKMPFQLVKN